MALHRFLTIITLSVIIILVATVQLSPPGDDFRQDNLSWNGISDVASATGATPLASLAALPPVPLGTALVLVPCTPLALPRLEQLRAYLTEGGTLVLADDFGHGNQLLSFLGLTARFSGSVLLDPVFHHESQEFPWIPRIATARLMMNIESLVFNHATSLANVTSRETLASSSSLSFLDLNGNESLDDDEPIGPLPVISRHDYGDGNIILISDPSVLINGMQPLADNSDLVSNIAAIAPSQVFIDQSHLPRAALHDAKDLLASLRDVLSTPVGASVLVALSLTITLIPLWKERRRR